MKCLIRLMRVSKGDGTFQHVSFMIPRSATQGRQKSFGSAEELERVRAIVFPTDQKTKDELATRGYTQRADVELTDEQASSLGWDGTITESD
jgi:hypothetical protein